MCRIVINICLVLLFSVSNVAGQLQNYDSFRQQKGLVSKLGILTVHQHKNRVYLELTESLFGRDFVYVAQVNKGAEMVARPLPSVGVFQFRLGENDKIYFCQDKYQERIVSPKHPLAKVFEDSNMQPVSDVFDIVAVDSICGRYVIDLTDVLTKGRKWAQVKFPQLRETRRDMELTEIVANDEGVVFTFNKEFSYVYPMNAAGVRGIEGTITVELGGMLRLLPQDNMSTKTVGNAQGFRSVKYSVYGKYPYGVEQDSLLVRWRLQIPKDKKKNYNRGQKVLPENPLVFYVEQSFPDRWFPYIVKAVRYWNKVFEGIGYKDALLVRKLENDVSSVTPKALIAYDLSDPVVANNLIFHPATGEILHCRINIGHGLWKEERERYYLLNGLDDNGSFIDFDSQKMAGELLCRVLSEEIGQVLGLQTIESKSAKEDLVRYAYGNTLLEGGIEKKNVIADSLRRVEKQIQTIQTVYRGIVDGKVKNCILQETDEGKKYICDVRNRLYKETLLRSVALLQTVTNSEDLKAIMHFFNVYAAEVNIGSDYMQDVLKCMMDEQVLRHLEKVELFEDWFSVIQSVFEGKSIDIQHLREEEVNLYWNIVDVLVEQATRMKISACDDDFQAVFYFKLQELYSQFANLEKTCSDKFAIIFYKRLLKKIEAVVIP